MFEKIPGDVDVSFRTSLRRCISTIAIIPDFGVGFRSFNYLYGVPLVL